MRKEEKKCARGIRGVLSGLAFCVVGLVVLSGCVAPAEGVNSVVRGTEQDDIPVPANFEFDRSWEFAPALASETGRFRSWTGVYHGPGRMHDLPPWYVGEMRKLGWRSVGVRGKNKFNHRFVLNFDKGDEVATITITRKFFAGEATSLNVVRAEIHPKGPENFAVDDLQNYDPVESAEQAQPIENPIKPAAFGESGDAAGTETTGTTETTETTGTRETTGKAAGAESEPEFSPATPLPPTSVLEEIDRVDQPGTNP